MAPTPKRGHHRKPAPYVGPPCCNCGFDTLWVPCSRPSCWHWLSVCGGCLDECERYIETAGRCPYCRAQ